MTSEAHFENVGRLYAAAYEWGASLPAPSAADDLLYLADRVRPAAGTVAVDLGSYAGRWSHMLSARYGCSTVALDIAASPLRTATSSGLPAVQADIEALPFATGTVSFVWCRDVLSGAGRLGAAIDEITRVLQPGAGAVVYTALTTDRLEPRERAELFSGLEAPEWWSGGREPIDNAIAATGLEVVYEERFSPQGEEAALESRNDELLNDLVLLARMERNPDGLQAVVGADRLARLQAWSRWPLYLLLGKLETRAWVLRRSH